MNEILLSDKYEDNFFFVSYTFGTQRGIPEEDVNTITDTLGKNICYNIFTQEEKAIKCFNSMKKYIIEINDIRNNCYNHKILYVFYNDYLRNYSRYCKINNAYVENSGTVYSCTSIGCGFSNDGGYVFYSSGLRGDADYYYAPSKNEPFRFLTVSLNNSSMCAKLTNDIEGIIKPGTCIYDLRYPSAAIHFYKYIKRKYYCKKVEDAYIISDTNKSIDILKPQLLNNDIILKTYNYIVLNSYLNDFFNKGSVYIQNESYIEPLKHINFIMVKDTNVKFYGEDGYRSGSCFYVKIKYMLQDNLESTTRRDVNLIKIHDHATSNFGSGDSYPLIYGQDGLLNIQIDMFNEALTKEIQHAEEYVFKIRDYIFKKEIENNVVPTTQEGILLQWFKTSAKNSNKETNNLETKFIDMKNNLINQYKTAEKLLNSYKYLNDKKPIPSIRIDENVLPCKNCFINSSDYIYDFEDEAIQEISCHKLYLKYHSKTRKTTFTMDLNDCYDKNTNTYFIRKEKNIC